MAEKLKRRRLELYCSLLAILGIFSCLLVGWSFYQGLEDRKHRKAEVVHAASFAMSILNKVDLFENNLQLATESAFQELGYVREVLKRFSVGARSSMSGRPLGRITAGKWHFDHSPLTMAFSQCYKRGGESLAETFQPCFVPNSTSSQQISAVSVELFEPNGGVHHAIATLTPIKVLVLMNLAESITRVSHSHAEAPYSFELENWQSCRKAGVSIEDVAPLQRRLFAEMRSSAGDYECHIGRYWSPVFRSQIKRAALVDKVRVPQPLNNILSAVHFMMDRLEKDGISGDRFGMLAFDNEIIPERGTHRGHTLGLVPPSSLDTEFKDVLEAARPFDDVGQRIPNNYRKFVSRLFFPRFFSDVIVEGLGSKTAGRRRLLAGTNYPGGFAEALGMLSREKYNQWSQNFVLFITDGVGDCTSSHDCNITNKNRYLSVTKAIESSLPALLKGRVKVNTVLYGNSAAPHTRLIRSGKSDDSCLDRLDCCMSEQEYAGLGNLAGLASLVTPEALVADDSPARPASTFPNIWQNLSQATGGVWQPLRTPCYKLGASGVSAEDIQRALQQVCAESEPLRGLKPGQFRSVFRRLFGDNFSHAVGNEGELYCDPESRPFGRQLREAVEDGILKSREVALVLAESRV